MRTKQLSWYVSYRVAHGNAMEIAKNRDAAIKVACAMLERGMDIQEVGPMIEPPEGKLIGPAELRELHKRRLATPHGRNAKKPGSAQVWERRTWAVKDLEKRTGLIIE